MKWWNQFWRVSEKPKGGLIWFVRLTLPGWSEESPTNDTRIWCNTDREALALGSLAHPYPGLERGDELELRKWARELAQRKGGGLI